MLVRTRHQRQKRQRRGIVLVLVLAMMGLLAVIGVTFATLSAQAKINARNFAQSVIQPQDDELMDFALQQLITDTADIRSAIRGHSLARDMYGNDAFANGYLTNYPGTTNPLLFTNISPVPGTPYYDVLTNMQVPTADPRMYGYNFERWIVRMTYTGPQPTLPGQFPLYPRAVNQTFEVLIDDYGQTGTNMTQFSGQGYHAFRIGIIDPAIASTNTNPPIGTYPMPNAQTVLNNPSLGFTTPGMFPGWDAPGGTQLSLAYVPTQLAIQQILNPYVANNSYYTSWVNYPLTLDGRWLHAFNGPGLSNQLSTPFNFSWSTTTGQNYTIPGYQVPLSTYGNFRYNGLHPNAIGMDEDYDAADLENWFLAIQSADGQVTIPSFHRPGIVRYQDQANRMDWDPAFRYAGGTPNADSLSRILRPVAADGHDAATFPDLVPDPTTGKITYDVDNDGDGITDSVWVDLGYPARRDARGKLFKPLFAFMVIGLNGRIPLNTAGNLAGPGARQAQHLGNSPSEIDPTYALQNAFSYGQDLDPFNQLGNVAGMPFTGPNGGMNSNSNTQVDNAVVVAGNNAGAYGSVDVRLTQLRNLLAGTRPQPNPYNPSGNLNGDLNVVWGSWPGHGPGTPYTLPNGIADGADNVYTTYTPPGGNFALPYVQRTTAPVGGRWGEASSIAGVPFTNPNNGPPLNLVQARYVNPPRAGYSFDIADLLNAISNGTAGYDANGDPIFPRDAADDNYNAFDMWPPRFTGEIGDTDLYDAAGALLLPVERMRRFVTPMDINGTGRVQTWGLNTDYGPDNFGRVQFFSYFRPAGVAGQINITTPFPTAAAPNSQVATGSQYPYGAITPGPYNPGGSAPNNGIYSTWSAGLPTNLVANATYIPDVTNNQLHGYESYKIPNQFQIPGATPPYVPNPPTPTYYPAAIGGMPIDMYPLSSAYPGGSTNGTTAGIPTGYTPPPVPAEVQTYDNMVNSNDRLDGVNEADEMNLYSLNPLLDSPFGPGDLEWLYRQQDVDGQTLTSRLSQLAPVSFTNTLDGQRRRRLFALQSWETNQAVWANDNPGGAFANNAWYFPAGGNAAGITSLPDPATNGTTTISATNTGFANLSAIATNNLGSTALLDAGTTTLLPAPALAHRERKINLNYPLPVSNDCNEPIRQRWISDTYQLLKAVLPPDSIDTAEERAQLSQFVINIIDFRDPDATMTHWVNPDVVITPGIQTGQMTGDGTPVYTYPSLALTLTGQGNLDQFGMEYNPVAINEVLAYAFQSRSPTNATAASVYTSRVFVELVNTLTAAYNPSYDYVGTNGGVVDPQNYYGYGPNNTNGNNNNSTTPPYQNTQATAPPMQASTLDLGGFSYLANDPYQGGCWDLVFTADNAMARPDPYRGDLVYNPNGVTYYGLIPLNRDSFQNATPAAPNGGDATLIPLAPNAAVTGIPYNFPGANQPTPPINYYYVIGSPTSANEANPISPTSGSTPQYPPMTQMLNPAWDPMYASTIIPTTFQWHQGILPGVQYNATTNQYTPPTNYQWKLPTFPLTSGGGGGGGGGGAVGSTITGQYLWVCLRRPANPFAPVSATNPMVVVDSMRFPYLDGTGNATWTYLQPPQVAQQQWMVSGAGGNVIYSAQRLQPYRGGHAVPVPNWPTSSVNPQGARVVSMPPDPRYGYSEQIAVPINYTQSQTYGLANIGGGIPNNASTNYFYHTLGFTNDGAENWDYLVFNDRDFTSVAELLLVPGCPPGLFTKQFVEFAPSQMNAADIFASVTPTVTPGSTLLSFNGNPTANPPTPSTPQYISTAGGTGGGSISYAVSPFATATVPFLSVSQVTINTMGTGGGVLPSVIPPMTGTNTPMTTQPTTVSNNTPVQPHAFPYLVDKFFYTGAATFLYPPLVPGDTATSMGTLIPGGAGTTDPSAMNQPVVGGPASDGWFKMLEFFEVPSQAMGAIGPVAAGVNFDWARQDTRPGQMNINLIVDEEAFYSVFGRQNGRNYNQDLLNSIQLPLLATYHANTGQLTLPYAMPLATMNNGAPPIPLGGPPVPLVVSAIQPNGAPNYAYPITDQTQLSMHGYLANDPITIALQTATNGSFSFQPNMVGNRIKAAFAQFLWARHGGSGYMFGYGNGATGQNSAVFTHINQVNAGAIPAERPFRALSYPDINYTVMRPAALPPSTVSNPAMVPSNNTNWTAAQNALMTPVVNAQALIYTPTTAPGTWYWYNSAVGSMPNYYAPYVTGTLAAQNFPASPVVYSGDPGVRNPFFNQGYAPSNGTTPYNTYPAQGSNSLPAGLPLPVNVAFPSGGAAPNLDTIAMPPPIPPARLFQVPDAFGAGQMAAKGYVGISGAAGATGNLPPAVSNATDSGDPWINNTVANQILTAWTNVANLPPLYTLNHAFLSLIWNGGAYYSSASNSVPYLPGNGVLPPTAINYAPYVQPYLNWSGTPGPVSHSNGYPAIAPPPGGPIINPYLGGNTAGVNTDDRQHPFWRTELLQKAMNLTTVRTHQYAVWITVGFFEVKRLGDIGMIAQGSPQLAFDIMGPELGVLDGRVKRFRSFFIVDRLQLSGFNPTNFNSFRSAVVYRNTIE